MNLHSICGLRGWYCERSLKHCSITENYTCGVWVWYLVQTLKLVDLWDKVSEASQKRIKRLISHLKYDDFFLFVEFECDFAKVHICFVWIGADRVCLGCAGAGHLRMSVLNRKMFLGCRLLMIWELFLGDRWEGLTGRDIKKEVKRDRFRQSQRKRWKVRLGGKKDRETERAGERRSYPQGREADKQ